MSYILEALRKSEQERNADKVPDLTTTHSQIHKKEKNNYFWWIIAVVLVVANGLYLFYKMNDDSTPTEVVNQPAVESEQEMLEVNNTTTEQQVQISENKPVVQAAPQNSTVHIDSKMLPDITTLSYSLQQQLPAMEYSTHIHVKEGGSFIIINGRSFGEGQSITQGLTIVQIQSDGIILDFKGRRFFMPSMTDWIQN